MLIFLIIHELAHGVTALMFGGELKGIWFSSFFGFGQKSNGVNCFTFYTYTTYNDNILCYRCVKIAGSFAAIISAFLINRISKKRKNLTIYLVSSNAIYIEILYWAISPLIKNGDAYQLLQSFKLVNITISLIFSLIFFMALILLFINLTTTYVEMFLPSMGRKIVENNNNFSNL
ncbi:MAG: hypothetical protein EU539_06010 [Promethearchaeota archaeon]|nr:MAG: hypothetical protein EU539_06010 [Candidatus Lokiarchaeota archaeon]